MMLAADADGAIWMPPESPNLRARIAQVWPAPTERRRRFVEHRIVDIETIVAHGLPRAEWTSLQLRKALSPTDTRKRSVDTALEIMRALGMVRERNGVFEFHDLLWRCRDAELLELDGSFCIRPEAHRAYAEKLTKADPHGVRVARYVSDFQRTDPSDDRGL